MTSNVSYHAGQVTREDRLALLKQKGAVLWFTGLSGSGKSTIASGLEKLLLEKKKLCYRLDGDNLRLGLNSDLDFSEKDRNENVRRVMEVSKLFMDAGLITLVCLISPFRAMRKLAKETIGKDRFFEIYVKTDFETCQKRDVKGLYSKASSGKILDFTGMSSPYEEPENPDLILDTTVSSVDESVTKVFQFLEDKI